MEDSHTTLLEPPNPQPGATVRLAHVDLALPVLPIVDGQPSEGAGHPFRDINPATGESIANVAGAGVDEIQRAVESAASAHALWRGSLFDERGRRLNRLADLILEQADSIAELIAREQGKPVVEALTLEVLPALDHLRYFAKHAAAVIALEPIEPRQPLYVHKRAHYLNDPLGVVALVTPYNLPFALPLVQVGAALAMGNAVVLKPSELAPLCGIRIGELVIDAGFPPGLVNVLPTRREDTLHLIAHRLVEKVFVTGTLETGQSVMATAGCAPRPVVLSLGGKHPSVVAADADIDRAARGVVWGATANAGQNCGSIERIYVEERVAARFLEAVLREVDTLKVGDPLDPATDIGPLISQQHRDRVHAQVTEAVKGGARLLRGGRIPPGPGYFYPPTVLIGPPQGSRILREETLGPVLPIVVVESIERALLLANDCETALTASGWTTSAETAERLMVGLQAGVVTVNDVLYSFDEPAATWSGFKRSGLGHTHGRAGLKEMSRQRFVSYDPQPAEAPLFAFPYDEQAAKLARAAMGALHEGSRLRRIRNLWRLFSNARFRSRLPWRSFLLYWRQRKRRL